MNLDFINDLVNNLKENKIVQNFTKELSNYLENNKNEEMKLSNGDSKWNNLLDDDLTLYNKKIITKYKDEMLIERANILQDYANKTKEEGEMYYIYNSNNKNSFDLCMCEKENSNKVITMQKEELPKDVTYGSVLRKIDGKFKLDTKATGIIGEEINKMIKEKIEEQDKFLESNRIEGHTYEAGEKNSGRIWLYDLNNNSNGGIEGIEEINFPQELYKNAKEGDTFIYQNGQYHKNN